MRIKEYLKIYYNETKIVKRIIVPGDQVEKYYTKNSKDWFKDKVYKMNKEKTDKGSSNTIMISNSKNL